MSYRLLWFDRPCELVAHMGRLNMKVLCDSLSAP